MNTVKYLFVTHSNETTGGAEIDFNRLIKYFSLKNDVSVYCLRPAGAEINDGTKYCKNTGFYRWGYLPIYFKNILSYFKYLFKFFLQKKQINEFIKKNKIDICIVNSSTLLWPIFIFKSKGIKTVVFVREFIQPKFVRYLAYKLISSYSDHVICISHKLKENFCKYSNLNEENISVVYTAIENDNVDNPIAKDVIIEQNLKMLSNGNVYKIVSIGPISENKNQLLLAKALSTLKNQLNVTNITCIFIGNFEVNDKYYKGLLRFAEKEHIAENIFFFGKVHNNSIQHIIYLSDCVVSASLDEGFSMVMLEAFKYKKPFITTPVADVGIIIDNHVNGIIIDYDHDQLASEILLLMNNRNIANHIGQQGYRSYLKINDLNKNLSDTDLILRKVYSAC
jgi:glycosyltransferase involved in cell wall biosynthesis